MGGVCGREGGYLVKDLLLQEDLPERSVFSDSCLRRGEGGATSSCGEFCIFFLSLFYVSSRGITIERHQAGGGRWCTSCTVGPERQVRQQVMIHLLPVLQQQYFFLRHNICSHFSLPLFPCHLS